MRSNQPRGLSVTCPPHAVGRAHDGREGGGFVGDTNLLRIGELARRAHVSPRTIDYYTRLGLLEPAVRTNGSHRLYDPSCIERIRHIRVLQEQRLSLEEIRDRLQKMADARLGTQALSALEETTNLLEKLQQQLALLTGQAKDLTEQPGRDELVRNVNMAIARSVSVLQALVFLATNLTSGV